MHSLAVAVALMLCLAAKPALAQQGEPTSPTPAMPEQVKPERDRLLWYLPNRLFDLMDIARARARMGPGAAASVRATRPLSLHLGAYTSIWGGLPGPRGEARIPWPFGMESLAAAKLGPLGDDATEFDPDYGQSEFGLGLQLLLLGADVSLDPVELADFLLGLALIDIQEDDH